MSDDFSKLMDMLLDRARKAGADAADGIVVGGHGHGVSVRMGAVESIERSEDHDIGLRVFVGQRNASISTSRLDEDSITTLAERAVAMAKLAPEDPYAMLAEPHQLATEIPELDMFDASTPSAEDLKSRALEAEDAARAVPGITNSEGGSASHGVVDVMIATSNGFSGRYNRSSFGFSAMVLSEKDGVMERDYDYSSAVYEADLKPPRDVGRNAGERTMERLGAIRPPTGDFPVIYDNRVSRSIASHIASAINGSAIARGTSFLKDKMGEAIAASGITLVDDPLRPRGMGSSPFDGEGLARRRRVMVDNGVLQGWFLDLAAAKQLGLDPTGNAGRGVGSAPSAGTSNWIMEPGEISRDALIAGVDEGFLVTEMIGSSVSLITGDYSRGASGFWIKNGKISHPVTEATIAGNLNDMLMNITLADDLDLTQSTAAPSLRIDGMTVAGGA
ncbi:MAG: TldD/PmbA family protein [Alphaproteobacteria bacterium]|nr:TldD/PmbA family protein [Alphaproteobacteria bacterium]